MNVLLALDESPCSSAALRSVINQWRPRDTTVRVLHVVEWPRELPPSLMFVEGPCAADRVVAAHEEIRRRARELVARAVFRLEQARFAVSGHVLEGDPREEILAMAAAWPADAVVMGSHGRKTFDRVLLGSVSHGVVRHATCSVQVIRQAVSDTDGDGLSAAS